MSCRRVCRELLWLARFGELGPSSAPHLDHLAECRSCRDEVGFDRALVQQLRIALAARIADAEPSERTWQTILERAQVPEPATPRLWERAGTIVGRLRTATAMAGTGLALVLALNMEVVTVDFAPERADTGRAEAASLLEVPRMPLERSVPSAPAGAAAAPVVAAGPADPETLMTQAEARIAPPTIQQPAAEEPAEEPVTTEVRVVFRALQSPEPPRSAGSPPAVEESFSWTPAGTEPGEPS